MSDSWASVTLADSWARWRWHLARERELGFPPSPTAEVAEEGRASPRAPRGTRGSPARVALPGIALCLWHWRALAQAAGESSARTRAGQLAPFWLNWRALVSHADGVGAPTGARAAERSRGVGGHSGGTAELREQALAAEARDTLSRAWQRWMLPVQYRRDLSGSAPGSHPHDFGVVGFQMLKRGPLQFCFELWRDNAQTVSRFVLIPGPFRPRYPPPPPPPSCACPDLHAGTGSYSGRVGAGELRPPPPSPFSSFRFPISGAQWTGARGSGGDDPNPDAGRARPQEGKAPPRTAGGRTEKDGVGGDRRCV